MLIENELLQNAEFGGSYEAHLLKTIPILPVLKRRTKLIPMF